MTFSWRFFAVGTLVIGGIMAALSFYRSRTDQQPVIATQAPESNAAAVSDSSAFSFFDQPREVPNIQFTNAVGSPQSLKDFRNRPILLNIWATWCVPCRKEMPALDRLQEELGASQLLVLPLSIDRQGLPVVKKFYDERGLISLGIYIDPSGDAASEINAVGLPTTLLIDRDGREIGRKIGPAEWDSPEVVALLRDHLGLPVSAQKAGP